MADFQPFNLAQIYGAADQANGQALQNQLVQLQMRKAQQEDADNQAMRGAYAINPDGTLDEKMTLGNLYKVNPKAALDFNNQLMSQKAAQAKAAREETDSKLGQAEKIYNIMKVSTGAVLANPTLDNAISQTMQFGKLTGQDVSGEIANLQSIGDNPDGIRKWAAGHALNAEQLLPKTQMQDIGGASRMLNIDPLTGKPTVISETAKTMTPAEIASNIIAQGQLSVAQGNLGVNQQRLGLEKAKEARGGAAPAGYRWKADGSLEAIAGGPADKASNLTESQANANIFATRAQEADAILNDLQKSGINKKGYIKSVAEATPFVGDSMGSLTNWTQSEGQQKVEQAQRDFVNAVLRKESGASISPSEFENAKKQYFPQVGDSDAVIAQKARSRATEIAGLKAASGAAGKAATKQIIPQGAAAGTVNKPVSKLKQNPDGSYNYGF